MRKNLMPGQHPGDPHMQSFNVKACRKYNESKENKSINRRT